MWIASGSADEPLGGSLAVGQPVPVGRLWRSRTIQLESNDVNGRALALAAALDPALHSTLELSVALDLERARAMDRALDLDHAVGLALDCYLAIDLNRALTNALTLDRAWGIDRAQTIDLTLARDVERALRSARVLKLDTAFLNELEALQQSARSEMVDAAWCDRLQQALVRYRDIAHDFPLDKSDFDILDQYLRGHDVLIGCLQSGRISPATREAIESSLFRSSPELT